MEKMGYTGESVLTPHPARSEAMTVHLQKALMSPFSGLQAAQQVFSFRYFRPAGDPLTLQD
jgi:hypothetical protein